MQPEVVIRPAPVSATIWFSVFISSGRLLYGRRIRNATRPQRLACQQQFAVLADLVGIKSFPRLLWSSGQQYDSWQVIEPCRPTIRSVRIRPQPLGEAAWISCDPYYFAQQSQP